MPRFSVSMSDAQDGTLGICLSCGEIQSGCEPDARNYLCESCGKHSIQGIEEALIMGEIDLKDEDDNTK